MLLSDQIYRFHQRAKKRIGHVHHHHADGFTDLRGQRLGIGVWPVAQQRHRLHYRLARIRTDQRAVI